MIRIKSPLGIGAFALLTVGVFVAFNYVPFPHLGNKRDGVGKPWVAHVGSISERRASEAGFTWTLANYGSQVVEPLTCTIALRTAGNSTVGSWQGLVPGVTQGFASRHLFTVVSISAGSFDDIKVKATKLHCKYHRAIPG